MGREVRRVPLDFDWPLEEVWRGFVNPHGEHRRNCGACEGSGYAPEARRFSDEWYGETPRDPRSHGVEPLTADSPAILARARRDVESGYHGRGEWGVRRRAEWLDEHFRGQWCHHLDQDDVDALVAADRLPESNGRRPTAREVNEWSVLGMGHDSINHHVCVRARCEREGVPLKCSSCGGDGHVWPSPEARALYEAWTEEEPPVGEGWQLWETVTEGSPISPVFATRGEFVDYLVGEGYSRGAAEKFAECGWAPSALFVGGEMLQNVEAMRPREEKGE